MKFLTALVLAASPAPLLAQQASAQVSHDSLADAVDSAISNNPTLMAERKTRAVADETLNQAQAQLGPQVSLTGSLNGDQLSYGRTISTPVGSFPLDGFAERAQLNLEARQSLWSGGSLTAQRDQARAGVDAAQARLVGVEQTLVINVVTAFMNVGRAEKDVDIREHNLEALGKQVQATRDRFDVGEVTRTDVAQAQAREAGARSELAASRARLAAARATYEQIVGRPPVQLASPPPAPAIPGTLAEAQAAALASNPDLQAARARETAGERGVDVARGALGPRFDLVGSAGVVSTHHDDTFNDTTLTLGARFSVPLFDSGLLQSKTRGAQLDADRARYERMAIERQILARVTSAWHQVIAAREEVGASASRVAAAETALEGVTQELAVGERITLDVLDQEQELLNARLGQVEAERAAYVAVFELLAAIGALKPELIAGR